MKYPSAKVISLHKFLKENREPFKNQQDNEKIKDLSEQERSQLFWMFHKTHDKKTGSFLEESELWGGVEALFRGDYSNTEILKAKNRPILTLAEMGVHMGALNIDDFRTITRFLYTNSVNTEFAVNEINDSIIRLIANMITFNNTALEKLYSLIRYFGLPPSGFEHLSNKLLEAFPNINDDIKKLKSLPIDTSQRYPEYTDEIAEKLDYDTNIPVLKLWLDHSLLNAITEKKITQFNEKWPSKEHDSNDKLFKDLEKELMSQKISSIPLVYNTFVKPHSKHLIPETVRTNELPSNIPPEMLQQYLERLVYPVRVKDKEIRITFLGGASIGTMGILVTTPQSCILFDYGLSVANYQIPFWHEALHSLDAIFVTHAHLDHTGAIPYLFSQGYSGYVFGSSMTKKLTNILIADSIKLMNQNFSKEACLYDFRFKALSQESFLFQMMDRFITIKSGVDYQITPDVVIRPFHAHHIQGSYAYQLESGNKKVLFSGDINFNQSELFRNQAPQIPVDSNLSILDGTYYSQPGFDNKKRDQILFNSVNESNRVIIPAFSVGRAQEILLKLDKAGITRHRKVSLLGMATKVAQLSGIKTKGHLSNNLVQPFDDEIIITGGGMLSGGYARELVEQTKTDPKTTIVLCGYLARNTLGYRLLNNLEPEYKQNIVYTRFSGHTSSDQLEKEISKFKGSTALVHLGELSKDPLTLEKEGKREKFKDESIFIPHLGTTVTI